MRSHTASVLLAVPAMLLPTTQAAARPLPEAPNCRLFPADNHWNKRVDTLPRASNSTTIINRIGAGDGLKADFGSGLWDGGPIGIPYTTVPGDQRRVPISFDYDDESDPGPYPIPPNAPIEGGSQSDGDRHVLVVDRDACKLWEVYDAHPPAPPQQRRGFHASARVVGGASWRAGSGATWSLSSNALRPAGWTSADAAGLPILPGLARFDEVKAGVIDHALRFTVRETRRAYVYPARHYASDKTDPALPPMGMRVRLRKSFPISSYPAQARVVLKALKTYGMLLADNGSNWYISGAPNAGWNNDQLQSLRNVKGRDLEVVDTSSLPKPGARSSRR